MEAGFGLEPLAGESEIDVGAGGGVDAAEGQIAGLPDLDACAVGGKHRPPDGIGADVERLPDIGASVP